jgi:DNA-binding IclR family transcriptional regulator
MNLFVRNGADCILIQQSLTKSIVNYVPTLNSVLPYYACAGGKILMSELPEPIIDQILSTFKMVALTPFTITDPASYKKELQKTQEQGYAIDYQESTINGSCIAVPVRDSEKTIIASLSFSGLIGIPSPDDLLRYLPSLKEASHAITDSLYRCWDR